MATLVLSMMITFPAYAQGPEVVGQWSAQFNLPLVTVHSALLHTGDVLMWDETAPSAKWLWRPSTGTLIQVPNNVNSFCAGHVTLADGRVFVVGGGQSASFAIPDAISFDPATSSWIPAPPMSYDRWYPTATTLSDGRVLVVSGSGRCLCQRTTPEVYDPVTNSWSQLPGAAFAMPNYPFIFQLPDGRVLYAGSDEADTDTWALDVATQTWTPIDSAIFAGGSSAMYRPGVVIKSGSSGLHAPFAPAVDTAFVIDMNQPVPAWQQVGSMAFGRSYHTLTLLPDGAVAAIGGLGTTDKFDEAQAVLPAEIWNPDTGAWSTMAAMQTLRSYHSISLLLPDGRVLASGSGRLGDLTDQLNAEIFSPPYLFKGARPTIASVQGAIAYNTNVFVETPDAANIASVSLVRPGAITHNFDHNQRYVPVTFTQAPGGLTVQLPANANIAPPGYYMLFLVNTNGVPSVATFVRFPAASEAEPPPVGGEIIIDNAASGVQDATRSFTGSWCPSGASNQFGASALHNCFGAQAATYRWTPTIPSAGDWDVYVWWGAQAFQSTAAAITVVSASGTVTQSFNELTGGGQWVLHGRYTFNAGTAGYVQTTNNGSGHVAADAVRFVQATSTPNPVPTLNVLSPGTATAGGPAFTLTVTGTNFIPTSIVRWNGADRPTTFVSATQRQAAIPASDISAAGSAQVTVFNPAPDGGTSNELTFTIDAPVASEIILDNAAPGVQDATRSFTGSWCPSGASNQFGASALHNCFGAQAATYRWTPTIPSAGAWDVYVWWGAQSFQSTAAAITVVSASGTVTQSFNEKTAGGQWVLHGQYTFNAGTAGYVQTTNNGSGHVAADAVRFVQATSAPNPVPTLSALSPGTATAGGPAFTLTVTGTNFVATSLVRWNGADRPTTFVSATQRQAAIPASDISAAGSAQVTVFNPAPDGGASNELTFTIDAPVASEIILDNAAPGVQDATRSFTGSWCPSGASNQFGASALHNCFGAQAATYRWTPTIPSAGAWDVYVWWGAQAFQSTAAAITVVSASGTVTQSFNEKTAGGQWVLHGQYTFNAGTAGYVQTTNNGSGHVAADAVRFVPAP